MADSKKIYIFKSLKEISKNIQHKSGYGFECGEVFTNENCMADYETTRINMVKRRGYTRCNKEEKNTYNLLNNETRSCQPNKFITERVDVDFVTVEQPEFKINEHKQNWVKLFNSIESIIGDRVDNPKVFISCHQHSLQKLFFNLDNTKVEEYAQYRSKESTYKWMGMKYPKKFGFRNCTCIKITSDDIEIVSSKPEMKNGEDTEKKNIYFSIQVQSKIC